MPDLLVRLYDLEPGPDLSALAARGVTVRRALAPERDRVVAFARGFEAGWGAECACGFPRQPIPVFIAHEGEDLLGFACHDVTARGLFGPTGVAERARRRGIGEALLFAALRDMLSAGYAYGVIGAPGPVDWYRKRLDAIEIPGSEPGWYRGLLSPEGFGS